MVFHALNRGNDRREIFAGDGDYEAFIRVLAETQERYPMRILAYCLMPNHWHLLLWPEQSGVLGVFLQRLTTTHVRRWHLHRQSVGCGHLYQGTYKSFPVQDDDHFYAVCRYVERNAKRANLVERAERWRWSSLAQRLGKLRTVEAPPKLSAWPVSRPRDWLKWVNQAQTEAELAALRKAIARGQPFGNETWQAQTADRLGLESTMRPRGRPRKQ
jgi:putative transposase